jgi:hypothetical protein
MVRESEEHGKERKPDEHRKRPYKTPTVTKRLITRAEKEKLLAEQNDKSKAAGGEG